MKVKKERLVGLILILFLLIPFVASQQVVQVAQPTQPEKSGGFLSGMFSVLKSPIFWGAVVIGALIIGFFVLVFFLVKWLVKYIKTRSDIFWRLRDERIKLAKIQRRFKANHFWKVQKNPAVRLVKINADGKPYITEPIGFYRGDYISNEGNITICMNLRDDKKWFFFPKTSLLVVPDKPRIEFKIKTKDGKEKKVKIENLPKAKDIVRFNETEVLIYAEGFSLVGQEVGFLVPVLRASDGRIVDLSLPVFQSLREVIIGNYLYEQTGEFVDVQKKAIHLNPDVQFKQKTADSSQSVEVQKSNP